MAGKLIYNHKKNTDITSILYNIDKSVNMFTKRIDIYNPEADETLQKFWIYIEKAKLLKKNKKRIRVAVFNKDKDLVTFMKCLDKKINETVKITNSHINEHGVSLELSESFPPVLELDIDQHSFVFDNDNNKIDFYNIPNGSSISMYIELEGVYLDNTSDFKNWKVLQMKENIIIDLGISLFDNPGLNGNNSASRTVTSSSVASTTASLPPTRSFHKSSNNTKPNQSSEARSGPPTVAELTGALMSLKKTTNDNECVSDNTENEKNDEVIERPALVFDPMSKLKKVITRESRSMVDILKEEHQNAQKKLIENTPSNDNNNDIDILDFKSTLKKYKKSFKKDKIGKKYSKLMNKINSNAD